MNYKKEKERDYNWLMKKLKSKNMFIEKDLFRACLYVIQSCDIYGKPKSKALKISSKKFEVTQKSIKETLDEIEYITQNQSKKIYNTKGYYESQKLEEIIKKDDKKEG